MKVLIQKNNITDSLKSRLDYVKKWFGDFQIDFTEELINKTIINGNYTYLDGNGKTNTYQAVDETWYDENISKPAKARGFDIVILILNEKDWLSNIVEGFGSVIADCGIEEIALKYFPTGQYSFTDSIRSIWLNGDKLSWIIIHELLHRIYAIKKLPVDNTHKYFLDNTPERCLEDFKMPTYTNFNPKSDPLMVGVSPLVMNIIQGVRTKTGIPITLTSGVRTPAQNQSAGGVANSSHLKGLALDFAVTNQNRQKFLNALINCGTPIFIEDCPDHIHFDIDSSIHQLGDMIISQVG